MAGYLGKAAAALHPGDPQAAAQWADGKKLRVLHGRAKAVAATLASVAAKARANPRTRHLDLAGMDKAVTYLTNNQMYMRYDKALASGWPIATGMIAELMMEFPEPGPAVAFAVVVAELPVSDHDPLDVTDGQVISALLAVAPASGRHYTRPGRGGGRAARNAAAAAGAPRTRCR